MPAKHYDVRSFDTNKSVGYLLKVAHSVMHDWVSAEFEQHDISFIQWVALMKVKERSVVTASDFCRKMMYDNGAVTRLIDQLEARGLLARERSKTDRRVVALKLTSAGEKKLAELVPVAVASLNEALSEFGKGEFAELSRLLNKLIVSLQLRQKAHAEGVA